MGSKSSDITLLINSLGEGGAQRVLLTLAKQFIQDGKTVTILSLGKKNLYEIPTGVNMVYFTKRPKDSMFLIPYYAWKLKQYVKKNKITTVQSYLFRANYVNIFSKILGSTQTVQVSNRSVVSRFLKEGVSGKINLLLIKLLYSKADLIMYVSERMKLDFHEQFNIRRDEVVIYNPYDISRILRESKEEIKNFTFKLDRRYLVTVGRLITLKCFQDVIESMKNLPNDVELILLGDGKEKEPLLSLAIEYNLEKRVHFLGQVSNPFQYISRSDIFVSSSSVEGFPNVLLESMICKTPIVSSDCVSGPREILAPNTDSSKQLSEGKEEAEYGVLYAVGDVKSLTASINQLLDNRELREAYIEKSFGRAKEFSIENIVKQYNSLF